jgi:pyruvate dehydrogenase E1 component beta subunit
MAIEIKMPALSPTMEEGTLAKWLVKEGDSVKSGDIMAEIETDKATMEFEAVDEGVIAKILVAEGTDNVKVGTAIAVLAEEGEDASTVTETRSGEDANAAPKNEATDGASPPMPEGAAAAEQESGTQQLVAAAEAHAPATPEIPEGTEMVKLTVREALRDAMAEEMRADDRVFVMGEEVAQYQGAYKVTQGLLDEFGDRRVIDTPITEYGFAGVGTGAAMGGLRPIIEFMTFNFAMQAIDHIINYDAADAKGLLKAAIRSEDPVVFLENELMYGRSFDVPKMDDFVLPIGKARIMREGKDVTLVSYSIGVGVALEAAEKLAEEGIDAEVIDLRTLRPLDTATVLKSLAKTNRMVVVEEGWPTCSIASELTAVVMEQGFDDLDAPVLRVANEDVPLPYAANLEKLALIDSAKVVKTVKKVCYKG